MDGVWWDISPWPASWPRGSAVDRLADSLSEKLEHEAEPLRELPVGVKRSEPVPRPSP
jgi:hypothetical protein